MDELKHLIFNRLQTVSMLAEEYGCEEIIRAVKEMAEAVRKHETKTKEE